MSISPVSQSAFSSFDQSIQGLANAKKTFDRATAKIAQGDITSSRMVDTIVGQRMFEGNASVIRAQDEMVGALLNVTR